jgi:hypothetical protein
VCRPAEASPDGLAVTGLFVMSLGWATPDAAHYSEWSHPVNFGATVNSSSTDIAPSISKSGLSLYFSSLRPGGFGGFDLWVSRRLKQTAPLGDTGESRARDQHGLQRSGRRSFARRTFPVLRERSPGWARRARHLGIVARPHTRRLRMATAGEPWSRSEFRSPRSRSRLFRE